MQLFTDSSGTNDWGALLVRQMAKRTMFGCPITAQKELFVIVMTVHTWGTLCQRQKILIHCDNLIVVTIWESGSTRAKKTMAWVRLLYYCAVRYHINVCIVHIEGVNTVMADCLSRFQQYKFR